MIDFIYEVENQWEDISYYASAKGALDYLDVPLEDQRRLIPRLHAEDSLWFPNGTVNRIRVKP